MVRIEGEIVINRPVDEVFDFVADERNEPRYNPRLLRAERSDRFSFRYGVPWRGLRQTLNPSSAGTAVRQVSNTPARVRVDAKAQTVTAVGAARTPQSGSVSGVVLLAPRGGIVVVVVGGGAPRCLQADCAAGR